MADLTDTLRELRTEVNSNVFAFGLKPVEGVDFQYFLTTKSLTINTFICPRMLNNSPTSIYKFKICLG